MRVYVNNIAIHFAFLTVGNKNGCHLLGDSRLCSLVYNLNYSAEIAPTGQAASQAPQERQVSLSISYWESPCEIALAGQPEAQVPQLMQLSEITYAIA